MTRLFTRVKNKRIARSASSTIAHSPWSKIKDGTSGQQWWGANDHSGQAGYGSPTTAAQRMRDLNIRSIRDGVAWTDAEKTKLETPGWTLSPPEFYFDYPAGTCPSNGSLVQLIASGSLWAPFVNGTHYYVVNKTGDTCQLSDTFDGPTVQHTGGSRAGGEYFRIGQTVTVSIASPCIVTWPGTVPQDGEVVVFYTTGALPTGLSIYPSMYVVKNRSGSTCEVSLTEGGASINTSGTQSGHHRVDYMHSFLATPTGSTESQNLFAVLQSHIDANYDVIFVLMILYGSSWAGSTSPQFSPSWRQALKKYAVRYTTELLNFGWPANRLVICMWNEPNGTTFGDYGIDYSDGTGVQKYSEACREVRAAVRALDTNIRVMGPEGVNAHWSGYNTWHTNFHSVSNFWAECVDIYSGHEYQEPYPTYPVPETLYGLFVPWAQDKMNLAVANSRSDMTYAITEAGYPSSLGDAVITPRYSRLPFLWSMAPGLEIVNLYSLRDNVQGFGLLDGGLNIVANRGTAVGHALAHVNKATARSHYVAGPVTAIKMTVPAADGGVRLALWHGTSGVLDNLSIVANQSGTLNIQVIGGSTSTANLVGGSNVISGISLSTTSVVLYCDDGTVISFPQLV